LLLLFGAGAGGFGAGVGCTTGFGFGFGFFRALSSCVTDLTDGDTPTTGATAGMVTVSV